MPRAKKNIEEKKTDAAMTSDESTTNAKEASDPASGLLDVLNSISTQLNRMEQRVTRIETGGVNAFMEEARPEDIQAAQEGRVGIDSKIIKIVDEILGSDFGIEISDNVDHPGFLFTLIVPQRLSSMPISQRPVRAGGPGEYKRDEFGNIVVEDYYPEDRRSRQIGSTQSYDVIRDHCNKVRGNIVGFYQKMKRPIPEFKLK